MSDLIRTAVKRAIEGNGKLSDSINERLAAVLREQQEKDAQFRELHQLLGITQKNVSEISQQLDRAHVQLEDQREHRSKENTMNPTILSKDQIDQYDRDGYRRSGFWAYPRSDRRESGSGDVAWRPDLRSGRTNLLAECAGRHPFIQ